MTLYSKNQLVWAKIKGYPWWPAIVAQSNQKKNGAIEDEVLVNFIGDNSHAFIALDKIGDFAEEFEQYHINKNKKLQESIKAAQRIQLKETTYEEERLRFLKKDKRQKSEDPSTPARSTQADKEDNDKKELDRKTSPKTKNPIKPLKEKERKVDEEIDDLKDFLPRFTRSVSKKENIEMLTEPLIYNSRKNQKSTSRGRRKSALKNQRNKAKKLVRLEKTAHSSSSLQEKEKTMKRDKQRLISRTGFYKKESVAKSDEMEIEHDESEEEEERKGSKKRDYELDEILNDVDEDCESFDLNIETCMEMEQDNSIKKSFGAVNKKRKLKIDEDEDEPAANFYITQGNDNDTKSTTDETECITKKVKMSTPCERESENFTPLANQGIQILSESDKKRIQLEEELEKALTMFSSRFQKQGEASLADESIVQLLHLIKEFENNNFEGSELVHSKLGKLFKTIQFMLIKNKSSLSKIEEAALVPLANVIHKIKLKIIEFSLDNTDYLTSFNLNENESTQKIAFAPINIDPLLVKMEESHNQQQIQALKIAEKKEPCLPTKMKIEEHVNGTGHQTLPIKMQESIALKNEHFHHHDVNQNSHHFHNMHKVNGETHKTTIQEQKQAHVGSEIVQLRKKICRKFASLLQKTYSMEKNKSQSLTLAIEDKINNFYSNSINEYKQSIKKLLKIIKGNQLEVEELIHTQTMGIHDFNNLLKNRLSLVMHTSESPENDEGVAGRANPHEIKIQYHNKIEYNGQHFAHALRPLLPSQNK